MKKVSDCLKELSEHNITKMIKICSSLVLVQKLYSVSPVYHNLLTSNVGTDGFTSFILGSQQSDALINTDAQLIPFPCGILLN